MPAVRINDDDELTGAITPTSTNPLARSLLTMRAEGAGSHVNVVLLDFNPEALFAGVKTALEATHLLAARTGRPIRLILLRPVTHDGEPGATFLEEHRETVIEERRRALDEAFTDIEWTIVCDKDLPFTSFGSDDVWLATHWMTAHALDVASRAGIIDARRVVYLVQDYEPDFFAGELDRPAAESTYRAGFTLLVNSRQVAAFLAARGITVDDTHVFSPEFDSHQLLIAASRRRAEPAPVIFFYGRPSTPRNMFTLGIEVLRRASVEFARRGTDVDFVMAGENGPDVELAHGFTLRNRGVLDRPTYFEQISRVDVGLTLQATPHPSHLPFDLGISGAFAVTNEVDGSRSSMHPRIFAAPATPEALSALLVTATDRSRSEDRVPIGYLPVKSGELGSSIRSAIAAVVEHSDLTQKQVTVTA